MTVDALPGEDGPLPMRYGGEPIIEAEALGVARRLARLTGRAVPDALPTGGDRLTPVGYRVHGALLARVRARAEMEGLTVTEVITTALTAYAAATPGSQVAYVLPPPPAPDAAPTPTLTPGRDLRFATAAELAERLGVPRSRVMSWVRLARQWGEELEGPRTARPRARTPVYDVERVAQVGATLRRRGPHHDPAAAASTTPTEPAPAPPTQ